MLILDGKAAAANLRNKLKKEIAGQLGEVGRKPGLAVILVGQDPASAVYVRNKEKNCHEVGISSFGYRLDSDTSQSDLEDLIQKLNLDPDVDGILLQLPLPGHLDSQKCLELILPEKDVDGFHPENVGRLTLGLPGFRSCTPAGIMTLLQAYDLSVTGKDCVIIGRSNIVGKPLALMLLGSNATVTVCHSRTSDLKGHVLQADFVFAAVGRPGFVTADMVKPGAVVVDVGINRTEDGLVGDCDFEGIREKALAMTPVPGGVGPMTIAQLLSNTVDSWKKRTSQT
ncbi:bifunctional methylenetetrahydrofolate dehydrogenase/methenyltetrahydrofolate cyclohydrolase FolD [Desulfonatronovibrio hydrogenovorans]|uniref:bifunctional methylenetetrahydrofolate dehydrogenase/methenyltetrahydrofolate cyclohydrolase FolD n=1 Tax=Desulfonatronovibrio hydrogenovorans TaxID=53245 RepID=UPI00048FBE92|nr:bifunctional methylenetetrahydrofolate dehydrogenase/methenyltetrahydrofolate cyclohydrolase FolD [Desulfonatronovibrio hydrogenovorans]